MAHNGHISRLLDGVSGIESISLPEKPMVVYMGYTFNIKDTAEHPVFFNFGLQSLNESAKVRTMAAVCHMTSQSQRLEIVLVGADSKIACWLRITANVVFMNGNSPDALIDTISPAGVSLFLHSPRTRSCGLKHSHFSPEV